MASTIEWKPIVVQFAAYRSVLPATSLTSGDHRAKLHTREQPRVALNREGDFDEIDSNGLTAVLLRSFWMRSVSARAASRSFRSLAASRFACLAAALLS